ncbi:NAD-dependent epimerase/dehydratase family protein [Leptospira noguchii]|uniref:NADH(P)-binding protein, PF13460 family n=1 Tax=Leptospira noguchii serovar Autumnalis str. ZUN142 TaxID=1085540 RepID=M6UD90_9LEPT|nr:NAD-dependent epimerase/dehydratase family protein [Leptospira noguchii]EMO43022.1 NADH(P)-binding protein, PF13460 family [Leptospira noguchii serovar Autumnalis str. ZUN142]EMS88650.1 NADH(P)-binding protein, PF13460 family [Leptospira noguchii str. Hook]UOG47572.1 NAD-dependent epimerase/dehydratase family protein [Leptospira noguchii]
MDKIEKVLILGHSGFIGSSLEKSLSELGNKEVIGCSLPDIDLTDFNSASQLALYFTPDTCLVLAAAVKRQFGDTLDAFHQNTKIVENVCKLLESNPIRRLIYFSSAAVYGEETENTNINENTQVNPTSFYGINKYTSERLLVKTCISNKTTSLVSLRPPLIYGPGDQAKTYGPSGFSASAKEGNPITLWGDGTELREFIYIEDVCRIVSYLIDTNFEGELNLVSGEKYCFADIISILKEVIPDLVVHIRERSKQKADNAFNPQKIKSILPSDFKFTSLRNGLSKLMNHIGDVSK